MVINMTSYQSTLTAFLQERIKANFEDADGAPFLLLMSTPIYIGADKIDPLQKEYRDLLENAQGVPDAGYEGIWVGKTNPRIFGIEAVPYSRLSNSAYRKLSRLFRNGHLEFYENYSPPPIVDWPTKAMPIDSYRITVSLLHFLLIAQQAYKISEITDPIALNLTLGNVAPSYLQPYSRSRYLPDDIFIWNDKLLSIDVTVSEFDNLSHIASEIMDRLFNAYGYEKNLHFNEEKELLQRR